ncbi:MULTISPECIES: GNAT family N-acetyltransferase [Thermotoga]|uniref:Acetyltransferase-related protein n=1 Tax=Thermotoga neapolitana (strain ATCC 49049 / DSM 4359 / NBRC 107923 / NS-E) TaxID=309803 RepID=B9K9E1_THENN|nr:MULTISPECIES: GNAT family N-acetyltransferase [Thermotoga]ACM23574.1 Acetyltransferase-related protein [Thermotoga neapolitana DSM 4359]AJG41470.1 acetyltransferase [Thermotoga sp. RQ7]KFZ21202.1 Acetyltransferase-related protein [Thermotoga neapolitana LA10]HBF10327.1 N-acetyltransferase [Thermotoga neapolitana]
MTIKRASEVSVIDLVNLVNEIFKDYAVPVNWDVYNFNLDVRENSISLDDSFVFFEEEKPVGFVLLCIRKDRGRIDSMGVIKPRRGTGLADMILKHALEHLVWKGVKSVVLEVVSTDQRAVRFYEKNGFKKKRHLHSFVLDRNIEGTGDVRFFETDEKRIHMYSLKARTDFNRNPNWQRECLTLLLADGRYRMERASWKDGEGYLVWGETPQSSFIVDAFAFRGNMDEFIRECVDHIQKESKKSLVTCTAVPEDDPLFHALEANGFQRVLTQYEMELRLV